jgi:RND family efflux transporter MFP subunit
MSIINKKSLATIAGISSVVLAIAINGALSANQQQTLPPQVVPQYPVVSVSEVMPISHQASVTAYGEVKSRNQLALTSQVSGQITYLSAKFLTGNTFAKGELLAEIEPIVYQQALANAQANLADAQLALAQEELNSNQAAEEWQQSGLASEQASDLVLRKPQLVAAKAKYTMAKKEVEKAQYDLAQTKLIAPFDALIVSKQVQVGSNVQTGTTLADLYDVSLFEVSLPLSAQQWQLLPKVNNTVEQLANIEVLLADETTHEQWLASVDRFERHLDTKSRQRSLVAVVEQPIALATPLFPGSFVKATIKGQEITQLWKLPASALINNETVWQVNDEDLLVYLPIKVMFSENNAVYVQPIEPLQKAKIVNRPLSSYLVNMKVSAKVEELL